MYRRLQHIRELDGLRGIAALSVLAHHVFFASINYNSWPSTERWAGQLSANGMYGVDLFFVLSGFLITSLLFERRHIGHYFHDFYWKRIFRILPVYFILLAALTYAGQISIPYAVVCALFVANFSSVFRIESEGPFWTLAIEEQFYLLWPQVIRRLSINIIRRIALGLVLGAEILRIASALFGHTNYRFTFFHCDGLALGAILACEYQCGSLNPTDASYKSPCFRWIALSCVVFIVICQILGRARLHVLYDAVVLTLFGILFFGLIGGVIKHTDCAGLRFLRLPPIMYVGSVSYSLYMIHTYVLQYVDSWVGAIEPGHEGIYWFRAAVIFGFSFILAAASRYVIEKPIQSLRKYFVTPK